MRTDFLRPRGPSPDGKGEGPIWKKVAWFFGLAFVSVLVVASTAYIMRGLLFL